MERQKLRTPSDCDKIKADEWLVEARRYLRKNEYHRVKKLCKQVIRILRRKETEPVI